MSDFYSAYGSGAPNWIASGLADRVSYAAANTEVTLLAPVVMPDHTVQFVELTGEPITPKQPITVRVDHKLHLGVPYVNNFFRDSDSPDSHRYISLSASATLTNEGILDRFPEEPDLPRLP